MLTIGPLTTYYDVLLWVNVSLLLLILPLLALQIWCRPILHRTWHSYRFTVGDKTCTPEMADVENSMCCPDGDGNGNDPKYKI